MRGMIVLAAFSLMLQANKNCLNGLADVTNKLIVDTAQLASTALVPVSGVAKGTIAGVKRLQEFIGEGTVQIIEDIGDSSPMGVKPEEFIAKNCQLYQSLPAELDWLDAGIKDRTDKARELETDIIAASIDNR